MSRTGGIEDRWTARVVPVKGITEEMSRRGWDRISEWWNSRYSPRGDVNREWVIDPALFRLLGPAQGLRVLDAGCGSGYLSRLLSAKGAAVVGVDLSPRLLEIARREESREPLRIEYHESDLARLSAFADASFDAVVSNVVMQDVVAYREAFREFGRVLRPGGRLVFSITHPCFDRPVPARWLREPPDSERIEEWPGLLVNRYYDRVAVWWSPAGKPSVVGFHRTLEDYVGALHDAGFVVSRMEEPVPSRDAVRRMYRQFADYVLAPNFLIIEAHRPSR
jgi:SAM-dependent methyltransferase